MTGAGPDRRADPPRRPGGGPRVLVGCLGAVAALALAGNPEVWAQVRPDTLRTRPDTLPEGLPTEEREADTSVAPAPPAPLFPPFPAALPTGWATGVWEWDREALLGSRALTLLELLSQIPGVIPVRGGDYGMPASLVVHGTGGGRLRIFRDGVELPPLEGGSPDLSQIGLGGLERVRVVRGVGELRVELTPLTREGDAPFSLVEAGTGDLNTNLFRGTFAHPRVLGGALVLTGDRLDTQGPLGREPGAMTSGWVRFVRPLGESWSLAAEMGSGSADRGSVFSPRRATRRESRVQFRWEPGGGLVGGVFWSSSSLRTQAPDTFLFGPVRRRRLGMDLGFESDRFRARGQVESVRGVGVPARRAMVEGAVGWGKVGGVAGEGEWEDWSDRSLGRWKARVWTGPWWGVSLFGEVGEGEGGVPYLPGRRNTGGESGGEGAGGALAGPWPQGRFARQSVLRYGFRVEKWGAFLQGARMVQEPDSVFPLVLPFDIGGVAVKAAKLEGGELQGRIPLYPSGLSLEGAVQWWGTPGVSAPAWRGEDRGAQGAIPPRPYLPRRSYEAGVAFHDVFLPSGNLEVWFDLGVEGRDPMPLPLEAPGFGAAPSSPSLAVVPFYQSWFVRLQVRVVTVRVFFLWENVTQRQRNQDLPGRVLPFSRSMYGVRWTLWN